MRHGGGWGLGKHVTLLGILTLLTSESGLFALVELWNGRSLESRRTQFLELDFPLSIW